MNTNLIIQFLASKFQVQEWTITGNVDSWSAISSTGITSSKEDYTTKELSDFLKSYEAAQLAETNAKAAEKAALLAKLGITADEAALLLS
jgi:hypothetical protein